MASEAVKVIVRCRPLNERELNLKCKVVVSMESTRGQCSIQNPNDLKNPPKPFFFDGSYFIDSTTDQIYADIAYPLVEGVTEGYNGTIFAYGQTGCGKSFTMQGITTPSSQRGIIPRAFDHIFETTSLSDATKYLVHASYLEIYNEEIRDLLGKNVKAKLDLKEHPEKGVYVAGLSMHKVVNVKDCQVVMDRGWQNRATGATLMNADSSRSHSIFTIYLEMADTDDDGDEHIRAGKLNLVDLAGSERQSKTGATGDRLKEATKINLSLSALGNVISALVDAKSKYIPYRDSKLTRLLQDSLGGNTKTLMVACLSPADNNYDETLSTLRYANRAKNIQNKPKINEDPKDALLRQYQEEIQRLQMMLAGQLPADDSLIALQAKQQMDTKRQDDVELERERMQKEYEEKLGEMQRQYEEQEADKAKLQEDMHRLRAYYDSRIADVDNNLKSSAEAARNEPERAVVAAPSAASIGASYAAPDAAPIGASYAAPDAAPIGASYAAPGAADAGDAAPKAVASAKAGGTEPTSVGTELAVESPYHEAGNDGVVYINREGAVTPDDHYTVGTESQLAVHVATTSMEHMSQEEALKRAGQRLQQLESGFVGGEQANNSEAKERRTRKKKHAEERKIRLAAANAELEDDGIMVGIYESIQDELRAKNKLLQKERENVDILKREVVDLQSEFEFDRIDYLDTIRKQEKQIRLLQSLLDKVQPCIRRDCNYSNLDKIKCIAKWDEENNEWALPGLVIERTTLPGSNGRASSPRNGFGSPSEEERYYHKLSNRNEPNAEYFQPRRASQLLVQTRTAAASMTSSSNPPAHGPHSELAASLSRSDMHAAAVHGQSAVDMETVGRRPTRLEALPLPGVGPGKKSRKKRADPF